jgi:chromate transport protein ChrA
MEGTYRCRIVLYHPSRYPYRNLLAFIKIMDSYRDSTFLYGIKPAIIAIILGAIFPLAKKSLKTVRLGIIGIILLLSLLQFNEIALLLALDSWLYFGTH